MIKLINFNNKICNLSINYDDSDRLAGSIDDDLESSIFVLNKLVLSFSHHKRAH